MNKFSFDIIWWLGWARTNVRLLWSDWMKIKQWYIRECFSSRISLRGFLTEPLTELGVGATHQYSLYPLCLFLNKECPQKMQIDSKVVRTHQFFQSEEESESDKSKGSNVVITTHQFLPPLLPRALSLRLKKRIWNIGKCLQLTCFLFKFLIPNLKKKYFFFFIHRHLKGYILISLWKYCFKKSLSDFKFWQGDFERQHMFVN